jgi:hypothetical protein
MSFFLFTTKLRIEPTIFNILHKSFTTRSNLVAQKIGQVKLLSEVKMSQLKKFKFFFENMIDKQPTIHSSI